MLQKHQIFRLRRAEMLFPNFMFISNFGSKKGDTVLESNSYSYTGITVSVIETEQVEKQLEIVQSLYNSNRLYQSK